MPHIHLSRRLPRSSRGRLSLYPLPMNLCISLCLSRVPLLDMHILLLPPTWFSVIMPSRSLSNLPFTNIKICLLTPIHLRYLPSTGSIRRNLLHSISIMASLGLRPLFRQTSRRAAAFLLQQMWKRQLCAKAPYKKYVSTSSRTYFLTLPRVLADSETLQCAVQFCKSLRYDSSFLK